MEFDTKVAIIVHEDIAVWQKLNVAAFLATGIAGAAPEAMGDRYIDAAGQASVSLLGQPIMVLAASGDVLRRIYGQASQRGVTRAAYVRSMFVTGHDAANREVFAAEPVEAMDLVGLALRGPRRDIDKATKGARPHP